VELARLHHCWAKALDGARQIVFLSGEPGIGKTTLMDAFVEHLRTQPEVRITHGQCVEQYGAGEAYLPLLEATTRLCQGPGSERRIEALKRYAPSWLVQLPGLLSPEDRAPLQQRVQGTSQERMLREMAEAAELFTRQRALVVVLEDLHWSDVSTLDWLMYMARRREPAKLLLLGTYRPADVLASKHPLSAVVQELQARQHGEEIRLTPLGEEAITAYLAKRFGKLPAPNALAATLAQRTGGNPLFIVNTVDYLVEQDIVTEEAGRWTIRADKIKEVSESIPDTLRQLIERQVERLSEEDKRALEVASVVGVEFTAAEAAVGLSGNIETLEFQYEHLARTGQFLRTEGVAEWPDGTLSGRYSFLHAVYHEVVSTRVGEARRMQSHRRIAERKEAAYGERTREVAAELAGHFEQGREYAKAVQYRRQAGEAAARSGGPQEALSHLKRGLELLTLLPDSPERIQHEVRLQLALTNPLYAIGGRTALEEMEYAYLRAYELCQRLGEPPQLASVLFGLCMVYELRGEVQKGLNLAEQLLTLAQKVQNPALLLRAHMALGNVLYFLGEFPASRRHLEQGLMVYDPDKHSPRVSNVAQDLGVVCCSRAGWVSWCLGYPEQARRSSDKGLALAHGLSHFLSEAFALDGAIGVAQECGELPTVEQHVTRLIALSQEQGFSYSRAWGRMAQGWLLVGQGKEEEGLAQLRQGLTLLRQGGQELGIAYFMGLLVEACGIAGRIDEGLAVVAEALTIGQRRGERFYDAELYRLKGQLVFQSAVRGPRSENPTPQFPPPNSQAEAEECFQKALEIARQQQAKSFELRAAMSLVRLRQQQVSALDSRNTQHVTRPTQQETHARRREAGALLQEIYNWFTEGFDTQDLQDAEALLQELGGTVERTGNRDRATGNRQQAEEARQRASLVVQGSTFKVQRAEPIPEARPPTPNAQDSALSLSILQPMAPSLAQDSGLGTQHLSSPSSSRFHREGEYWTLVFHGTTARLKDTRGLQYLAHLLQHPGQEFSALALAADTPDFSASALTGTSLLSEARDPATATVHIAGFTDAGEVLDPQAKAAYRQRLTELQAELDEAHEFNDVGRVEKLQDELEFVTHELAGAVGLRGRARKAASPQERARVNVTRAMRTAIARVAEVHPVLGQYLTQTIKTGAFCVYMPEPHTSLTWQF
jgi:tetratricopeptide (TPR) repeat protein